VLSFLLIFFVLMPLSNYLQSISPDKRSQRDSRATSEYIKSQTARLVKLSKGGRTYTWGEGYNVGRESPVFGVGYESFFWHANILAKTTESYYHNFYSKLKYIHQTPHSVFFSIFASGGIVGFSLWILIIGYSVMVLIVDLAKNKRLLNIPVIISIISFHTYGIFQSMQYIPMIWLLIFLCLGYAMTVDRAVLPVRVRRVMGVLTKISVMLVVIAFFVYLGNFESRGLAEKYGMKIYSTDQKRDKFAGFHQPSQRWKYGDYRWSGKRGAVYVPGGGTIELEFYCRTPELEKEPVVVMVFHDGKLIDKISFTKKGSVRKKYELPETPGETQRLVLEVSRTWIPHEHLGNFDRRELGVGVKILKTEDGGQRSGWEKTEI